MAMPSHASAVRCQSARHLFCLSAFQCSCFQKIINVLCNCCLRFAPVSAVCVREYSKLIKPKSCSLLLLQLQEVQRTTGACCRQMSHFFQHSTVGNSRRKGKDGMEMESELPARTVTQTKSKVSLAEYHGKICAAGAVQMPRFTTEMLIRGGEKRKSKL